MKLDQQPRLLKRRRTKIVATLGPATADEAVVRQLIDAGVDVFRLNMAHGDRAGHRELCDRVRAAAAAADAQVAVLADLAGPKIRVGDFPGGSIDLADGGAVTVTSRDEPGDASTIPIGYGTLSDEVEPGHRLLLDDGKLELLVEAVVGEDVTCTVVHGGRLAVRKGVNFPDTALSVSAPTDNDLADARFAVELGVDFLGLSFVRSADDVRRLRTYVESVGGDVPIVAKIEKPEALGCAAEIFEVADAVMVARGDLGVEVPLENVPAAQDELVEIGRLRNKPVIIATQMLDSMMAHPRPTRAEVSDVAHAVSSGTDAVMLSGETAVGDHPVDAVETMDRIIRRTEAGQWEESAFHGLTQDEEPAHHGAFRVHDAVGRAVSQLSRDLSVRAILVLSESGASARIVSSSRPAAPLLGASVDLRTCRRMNLFWGVVPTVITERDKGDAVALFRRLVVELGLAQGGEAGLVVRGFRDDLAANMPSIRVVTA